MNMNLGTEVQSNKGAFGDRIGNLQQRIIMLKRQSRDPQFCAYLDQVWAELMNSEIRIGQMEEAVEQNYRIYLGRMQQAAVQPISQPMAQQPISQPAPQAVSQPAPQTVMQTPPQPVQGDERFAQAAQSKLEPLGEWKLPPGKGAEGQTMPGAVPVSAEPWQSVEFKIGTVVFGILGIVFLLVAFVTFGLNYMDNVGQGVFLYIVAVLILAGSEFYFAKRLEKFSYCLTGFGVSALYITTILNYVYLKIYSVYAALTITVLITAFFFWMSRKKDSGTIRIICLLGCYISMIPIHQLKGIGEFAIPAGIIFLVNLAGVFYPLRKKQKAVDVIQYTGSFSVLFYLMYLQWASGLEMWPVFILAAANLFTLHLLYYRTDDSLCYRVLYLVGLSVSVICLLWVGNHEYWIHYGVLGMLVFTAAMTALLRKKLLRAAPYYAFALYGLMVYALDQRAFWLTVFALAVFAVNKACVRFFKEFEIVDAVYTAASAFAVCIFTRGGEAQIPGYIYAACILLSCLIVKKYVYYHMYLCLTFGWLFLLTEGFLPFVCSISICLLALFSLSVGFLRREKGERIYGLSLMGFVALKLIFYDFHESQAGVRILVFLVVGSAILATSYIYLHLEKKLNEANKKALQEASKAGD